MRWMRVRGAKRTDARADDHRAIDPGGRTLVVQLRVAQRAALRTDGGRRGRAIRADVRADDHRAIDAPRRTDWVELRVALRAGLCADGSRTRAMWPEVCAEHCAINPGRRASESVWTSHTHLGADGGQCLRTADRLLSELLLPTASRLACGTLAGNALTAGEALTTELRRAINAADYRTLGAAHRDRADLALERMRWWTLGYGPRAQRGQWRRRPGTPWFLMRVAVRELCADRRRSRWTAGSDERALRPGQCRASEEGAVAW